MPELDRTSNSFEYPDAIVGAAEAGRGAVLNPKNRYENHRLHVLGEFLDEHEDELKNEQDGEIQPAQPTVVYRDKTRTIINRVSVASTDLPFSWTMNPYRGCEHGCVYCYARPDHERLGFSSGLDFETRIMAKVDAPALLRNELAAAKWQPQTVAMSGVTDCYQPIERHLRITRGCLEVMAECRQPVGIVTKNRLVLRDLDLLQELAKHSAARVAISVTTLDNRLSAKMEPRASSPSERLATIKELSEAGVPVIAMVAPIIPGLTDKETPAILKAVKEAGAIGAGYVLLRLPHQLKQLFLDWLARHFPDRAGHVESLIRQTRSGELYDARTGIRQVGQGPIAEQIAAMFKVFTKRFGLAAPLPPLSGRSFVRPMRVDKHQPNLFE